MSLRFILVTAWILPLLMLGWILYHERSSQDQSDLETNSRMRIRMCREHIDTAKADPSDSIARKAIEDCVLAGYITQQDAKTVVD